MYTTKRGKFFYVGYNEGSKIRWKSSKCRNRADFVEWLKQFDQSKQKKRPHYTISAFIPLLKERLKVALRKATLQGYVSSLQRLQTVIGDVDIANVSVNDLETYKTVRLKGDRSRNLRKVTPTTLNIELRSIKSAFNKAYKWEILEEHPLKGVSLLKIDSKPVQWLTKEELQTILDKTKSPVLKDLFEFAAHSGLRLGELRNLIWNYVEFRPDRIYITVANLAGFKTKSGKNRTIPLDRTASEILKRKYASRCEKSYYVFDRDRMGKGIQLTKSWVTHSFKKSARAAELGNYKLHHLRHTAASWAAQKGVPIAALKELLGHQSINTTMIYAHIGESALSHEIAKLD